MSEVLKQMVTVIPPDVPQINPHTQLSTPTNATVGFTFTLRRKLLNIFYLSV